jgi:outer membrane murein-binding lipoprotein Lpp
MAKTPLAKTPAPKTIELALSVDEAEMLIDALEADHEGYVDAVKEARGNNNRDDVKTFSEAATRIQELMAKIQELIGEE